MGSISFQKGKGLKDKARKILVETVIHKAISTDPEDRYASARAFANDLRCINSGMPISAKRHSVVEHLYRWAKRRPLVAGLSIVSLLLLCAVALTAATGYFQVQRSLTRAVAAEVSSRETADIATEALDQLFHRFADIDQNPPDQTHEADASLPALRAPAISRQTAELLEQLLPYYDRLAMIQERKQLNDETAQSHASNLKSDASQSVRAARIHLADLHFRLGNFTDAANAYNAVLRDQDPSGDAIGIIHLRNRIGHCYELSGERERADRYYGETLDRLQQMEQSKADVQFALAQTHYLRGANFRPGVTPVSLPPRDCFDRPQLLSGNFADEEPTGRSRLSNSENEDLLMCLNLCEVLTQQFPASTKYKLQRAIVSRELGADTLPRVDSDSQTTSNRGVAILEDLYQANPASARVRWELATSLSDFNVFRSWHRDFVDLGIERLDQAEEILISLLQERPGVAQYEIALVHTYYKRSQLRQQLVQSNPPPGDRGPEPSHFDEPHRRRGPPRLAPGTRRDRGGPGPPPNGRENRAAVDALIVSDVRRAIRGIDALLRDQRGAVGYRAWKALFQWQLSETLMRAHDLDRAKSTIDRSLSNWNGLAEELPEHEIIQQGIEESSRTLRRILWHPEYESPTQNDSTVNEPDPIDTAEGIRPSAFAPAHDGTRSR